MYLKGKKFAEEANFQDVFPKAEVKARIKQLVPETGRKLYKEIIDIIEQEYVAQNIHLKTGEILVCIKEIDEEWHSAEEAKETTVEI